MFDIVIVGAGVSGATLGSKSSKYAKTLLIEAQDYQKEIQENLFLGGRNISGLFLPAKKFAIDFFYLFDHVNPLSPS